MVYPLNVFQPKHCINFSSESTRDELYIILFKYTILMPNTDRNVSHSIGIRGALTYFLLRMQFRILNADRISPLADMRLLNSELSPQGCSER
jgi:hypothetical protein